MHGLPQQFEAFAPFTGMIGASEQIEAGGVKSQVLLCLDPLWFEDMRIDSVGNDFDARVFEQSAAAGAVCHPVARTNNDQAGVNAPERFSQARFGEGKAP